MKRSEFIRETGIFSVGLSMLPEIFYLPSAQSLQLLVLGGTRFVGPAIVSAAKQAGHHVTLFNRGISNPSLFDELPLLKGDREKGPAVYESLKTKTWDVVIDVWPEKSKLVDEATSALQANTDHYVFISSVAVYNDFNEVGMTENTPLVSLPDNKNEWGYSEEKTEAERIVAERYPDNHTILRPCPIKGWRDPAYDLLYWFVRLEKNLPIIAPGTGNDILQFIDVSDVGKFAIEACEKKLTGAYNCVGPQNDPLTWRQFLETAKETLHSKSELHWCSESFLEEQKVQAWDDLPLWTPVSYDAFMQISNTKALKAGMVYTPIEKTIGDCMQWYEKSDRPDLLSDQSEVAVGLSRKREMEVLDEK